MNFTLQESIAHCSNFLPASYPNRLIISPPAPYLAYLSSEFPEIEFSAQNVSHSDKEGPYTGEYSSYMLKSCNINYAIVGHSERRCNFFESDDMIRLKIANCLKSDVTPIICIGEDSKARRDATYENSLRMQLSNIIPENLPMKKIIIAYEPIWAIGTNIIPSCNELLDAFSIIACYLRKSEVANNVSLLYGGSVGEDNINEIFSVPNIDGVLVGKSSLRYETMIEMLNLRFA